MRYVWVLVPLLLVCYVIAQAPSTQTPATIGDQFSSEEHLAKPGWWPRKGDTPRSAYVGAEACGQCHSDLVKGQQQHAMAHTAISPEAEELPGGKISFDHGPFHYTLLKQNGGITYTVTGNGESFSAPIEWVFGSGARGQSFLFEQKGSFEEARISYFREFGIGITPDHPAAIPNSLESALGRPIPKEEEGPCFGCHTTAANVGNHLDTSHFMPGISCEGCHGPGGAHVATIEAGNSKPGTIFNPASLNPSTSVDFCGSCHRTWWDIEDLPYRGINNARFPAYRLEGSRCWGKGDARITCIACHDPHQPLVKSLAAYDQKCLACHAASPAQRLADHPGAACPVATSKCASCHMPRYEIPKMHTVFTDHRIRIVRDSSAAAFPD